VPVLHIPEAVEEQYFAPAATAGNAIGVFVRPLLREILEQTRDDVEWRLFDRVPTPEDLAQVAVWLDPAVADDDFDGFVAEALAMGRIVVAARTPINVQRLEKGRIGFLAPQRDANEMTHAILTALFKPEVSRPRSDAARQTVSKFKPRQRVRALTGLYERLRS
jgi:glycosyltransferase involved in cell wall biosynthesis